VRVVLADDSALLRAGVAELLRHEGFDVVAEVGDPDALLEAVRTLRPDVAVVDVRMPPTHTVEGLAAARQIRAELGEAVGILVLSQHLEARHAAELLASSTRGIGYLLKDRVLRPQDLATAVREIGRGGSAIDPEVVSFLLNRKLTGTAVAALTAREREVLGLIAEGRSNRSVAAALFVTEKTVESYTTKIFDKLGLPEDPEAHRRVQAVLAWLRPPDSSTGQPSSPA
jgi:DNA-binding NarL/FixJ family response regulator